MKRTLTLVSSLLLCLNGITQNFHFVKITLDTRKFPNTSCSLNAPADGVTPSPLNKIYMHAGVCWYDGASGSSAINSNPAEAFCQLQITPLNSGVWQSVVGNWGAFPQDDNVGVMVDQGSGIWTKEFVLEQYFSAPDVSTETNTLSTPPVTSMPMNINATPYTMGLVFRDPTGAISGRDSTCNDIFIWKLNTTPEVIQSDFNAWPNGPVSFVYQLASLDEKDLWYDHQVYPNPFSERVTLKFLLPRIQKSVQVEVIDALGRTVRTLYNGELSAGNHLITWDGSNDDNGLAENGIYFIRMRAGVTTSSERIILNR